ncbi:hypothetical protein SMC26_39075 [Actinomadura fulvescens]|uniref:Uncharacterized protein n=1 Tax=Actinomadura fulvescens TaxID=46160 RepID=A0ABN3QW04_9ACTN
MPFAPPPAPRRLIWRVATPYGFNALASVVDAAARAPAQLRLVEPFDIQPRPIDLRAVGGEGFDEAGRVHRVLNRQPYLTDVVDEVALVDRVGRLARGLTGERPGGDAQCERPLADVFGLGLLDERGAYGAALAATECSAR